VAPPLLRGATRRLIVTGDDFGLANPVNEAVELAHRDGILTTASLMVSGGAAADAVERARRMPKLRVGLHLVLVEGRSALPPEQVPDLVDEAGEFSCDFVRAGFRFFFLPAVRRQLAAEIRAQFEAFANTGLTLDHVNAHNHMHLHPTVLSAIISVGRDFGLAAVRVPYEPPLVSWRAAGEGLLPRAWGSLSLRPWTALVRARLRRAGIHSNDFVFGLHDSGAMDESRVLALAENLPEGVSELYLHLATGRCAELDRHTPDSRNEAELEAVLSPRVAESLERRGVELVAFSHLTESQPKGA
jgi:hopanoid biosynthesis associated protein HpnK